MAKTTKMLENNEQFLGFLAILPVNNKQKLLASVPKVAKKQPRSLTEVFIARWGWKVANLVQSIYPESTH